MRFFDQEWPVTTALIAMFFDDDEKRSLDKARRRALTGLIAKVFAGIKDTSLDIDEPEKKLIINIVSALQRTIPLVMTDLSLLPVLWIRWALLTPGLPTLTTKCCVGFSNSRVKFQQKYVIVLQYESPASGKTRGRRLKPIPGMTVQGYTIDEVLLRSALCEGRNPYILIWTTKKIELPSLKFSSKKSIRKPVAGYEKFRTACGTGTLKALEEHIGNAFILQAPPVLLSREKSDDRYICFLSRAELIEQLQIRYPDLKRFSTATLVKGVSKFVACPKGKPRSK